jgi:ferredoxin
MIRVNEAACPQNHPCPAVGYCPAGAIVQDTVFAAPRVDQDLCTGCGACTQICRAFSPTSDGVGVR